MRGWLVNGIDGIGVRHSGSQDLDTQAALAVGWIGPAGCGAWTSAPARSPRPRPLPDVDVGRVKVAVGLAHGDGAVWVAGPDALGLQGGGILLRVDPASGRVVGWLRDPRWVIQAVLADGPRGAWIGTATPELLQVAPA